MKNTIKLFVAAVLAVGVAGSAQAQKLDKFGADMGKKSVMGKEIRVPYTDVVSYFGYIKPGLKPDEEKGGKKYYHIYVWIPAAAPEIGVRMISPVPEGTNPAETDFVSAPYKENMADTKSYFDTWISLEKAAGVTSKEAVKEKAKGATCPCRMISPQPFSGIRASRTHPSPHCRMPTD